ncbi:MAG TPA: hypothetical protein VGE79_03215 [Niastella sp.]
MNKFFFILALSFICQYHAFAQSNYALQVKKDAVQINAKSFSVENNISIKNNIVMKKFKNNPSEDSVLSTDIDGNLKFKKVDAGQSIYESIIEYTAINANAFTLVPDDSIKVSVTGADGSSAIYWLLNNSVDKFRCPLPTPWDVLVEAKNHNVGKLLDMQLDASRLWQLEDGAGQATPAYSYQRVIIPSADSVKWSLKDVGAMFIGFNHADSAETITGRFSGDVLPINVSLRNESQYQRFGVRVFNTEFNVPPAGTVSQKFYTSFSNGISILEFSNYGYIPRRSGGYSPYWEFIVQPLRVVVKKNGEVFSETLVNSGSANISNLEFDTTWQDIEVIISPQ